MNNALSKATVRTILGLIDGVNYKDWQTIERCINDEYKRLANKNTISDSETILKNIMLDLT